MPTSAAGNKTRPQHGLSLGSSFGPSFGLPNGQHTAACEGKAPGPHALRGFTLIELMVVVAIIAIASAGVVFALRDSAASQLEREGLRLAALLESARAQSRSSGQALRWRAVDGGFRFETVSEAAKITPDGTRDAASPTDGASSLPGLPSRWLGADIRVQGSPALVLGPEPILPPQAVVLESAALPGRPIQVFSDGVRPFHVGAPGIPAEASR